MDTVAEYALRKRIAQLERELMLARRDRSDWGPLDQVTPPKTIELVHPPQQVLRLAASWEADCDDAGRIIVRGESWCEPPEQKFGVQYYLDRALLLRANDALYILGEEHKRIIRKLAEHYV